MESLHKRADTITGDIAKPTQKAYTFFTLIPKCFSTLQSSTTPQLVELMQGGLWNRNYSSWIDSCSPMPFRTPQCTDMRQDDNRPINFGGKINLQYFVGTEYIRAETEPFGGRFSGIPHK